jgi:hypothetical protein
MYFKLLYQDPTGDEEGEKKQKQYHQGLKL